MEHKAGGKYSHFQEIRQDKKRTPDKRNPLFLFEKIGNGFDQIFGIFGTGSFVGRVHRQLG